jgi:hypothetical protein
MENKYYKSATEGANSLTSENYIREELNWMMSLIEELFEKINKLENERKK